MRRFAFVSHLDLNLHRFRLPVMRELARRGCEVYAVCPDGPYARRFAGEGLRHVGYRLDRGSLNPLREAASVASLAAALRRVRPDLVHTFTFKPNVYGALAALGVPRARRVASVTGLGSFYGPRTAFLYKVALRGADRVVFYNADDRAELLRRGACRPRQCALINGSGVDTARFAPAPAPRVDEGPVVVTMAARLIREKGVHDYLQAAALVKAAWGERVVFQLAGEADEGNPSSADMERVASFAERGVVRRLGFVEDMAALLRRSDVYALPSYYREGIPVSVLEAMSAGLAVVTTDAVGCRETVEPEESGLRVPARDPVALAAALDRLVADASLRRRLGEAARRRAQDVFSLDRVVEAHLDVYRALLPGAGL